ncbi:MAG: methylmalonyl-CoA mutase, partial [Rhizobiales bacterium]|nr:methylmalonyl-CoA mutase [Hyphomicrobiales bacterium]
DEFSAETVEEHYQFNDYFSKGAKLSLGIDPIGKLAISGIQTTDEVQLKSLIQNALDQFNATHILRVDGRIAHNAGASEAQELSFIISSALTYLKWADEANIDLNIAAQKIEICVSTTQNQFITIAKIRALRQLWAELLDGLSIKQSEAYIFAETSFRIITKRDPWVNILRATVACFSAGLGGANQIAIQPLSSAIGLAPSFDRRIARHIQTILIEESHLANVNDPSNGSAYIETLTTEITQKSWVAFQEIEKSNGIIECLINGTIQAQIAQTTAQR